MIIDKLIYQPVDVGDCAVTLLSKEEYLKNRELIPLVKGYWWLRSPGYVDNEAMFVYGEPGDVDDLGYDVRDDLGVRPALKIEHHERLKPGQKVGIKGLYFTVLNDGLLLCDTIVIRIMFDRLLNDYDTSYVKHWLENTWAVGVKQ